MIDTAIDVRHVTKTFRRYHAERPWTVQELLAKGFSNLRPVDRHVALRDVSFQVPRGRTVGIVGSNGSGKSTLLRLAAGVGRPDSGTVAVNGRICALLDLGSGFQPDLSGRENAIMAGVMSGLTRRQVLARLDSIVAFAEVEAFIDSPLRTYSTGMQMRLAFATAVHADPEVLLVDEVLSVGDLAFQRKCLDRIDQFKRDGCSILLVSHEVSMIEDLCDEALWLKSGTLMAHGPAADVVHEYVSHMGGGTSPEPRPQNEVVPRASRTTMTTDRGAAIVVDEDRFGSMEVEITSARLLDANHQEVSELSSGQLLRIEITCAAARRVIAPLLRVRIVRDDRVVCCDITSEQSMLSVSALDGERQLLLTIDRLDLSAGRYSVDVGCYAQDWAYAYDYRPSFWSFVIQPSESTNGVLSVPYSWQIDGVSAAPLAAPVRGSRGE